MRMLKESDINYNLVPKCRDPFGCYMLALSRLNENARALGKRLYKMPRGQWTSQHIYDRWK